MKATEYLETAELAIQKHFNTHFKPLLIKEAKRLKIKKIEDVMGVTFFTLNNGKAFTDDEFSESSEVRHIFVDQFINPFKMGWAYSTINTDITP